MSSNPRLPVIGIGASAGGVEAIGALLRALPADLDAAVLVVLHLQPHAVSQLEAVLTTRTRLRVRTAQHGERVRAGHVYVAPPDRHLMLEGGHIRLSRGPRECRVRPAVDVLFRSLALACGPYAAGAVLSGLLDDGTAGLWAIKEQRGRAYAQHPAEALHPSMPESAAEHVDLDGVAPVAELAGELAQWARRLAAGDVQDGRAPEDRHVLENSIAAQVNGLKSGVMHLGPQSRYSCPDCHGVLMEIEEGRVVRYRCHTGHAFSPKTLLADVEAAIDTGLWSTVRAMEERLLLLQQLADQSRQGGRAAEAEHYRREAKELEGPIETLRKLVLDPRLLGHESVAAD